MEEEMTMILKVLLLAALCWMVWWGWNDPMTLKHEPGIRPDKVVGSAVILIGGGFLIFTWKRK